MLSDLYKRLVGKEIIVCNPIISTWDDWLGFILGFTFILDLVCLFNFFWYLVCLFISTCGKYFSAIKKCYVAIMCTIWLKKLTNCLCYVSIDRELMKLQGCVDSFCSPISVWAKDIYVLCLIYVMSIMPQCYDIPSLLLLLQNYFDYLDKYQYYNSIFLRCHTLHTHILQR